MNKLLILTTALLATCLPLMAQQRVSILDSALVNPVWSGHPVDFALINKGDSLYAGYYYGNTKSLTISMRNPVTGIWKHKTLNTAVAWDSHNYVTLAFDAQGLLHVSANMHNVPLLYWRSDVPGEIDSLKQVTTMIGNGGVANFESSVTYPVFVKGSGNDFVFMYREGSSGNGNQIINKWNPATKTWSRLLSTNLFSGASTSGTRSVYFGSPSAGPVAGPGDGLYHLFFFWRATPDAATTHRVSYMRSTDLINWQTGNGTGVILPVSFDNNPGVIVDNVPQFAGLINRGQIGFDSQKRPIITYHKFDSTVAGGYTQLYNARLENGTWKVYKTTSWPYRWDFGGQGSLVIQIQFGPVVLNANGTLTQWYSHWQLGRGVLLLNEATLQPTQVLPDAYWPQSLDTAYRVVNSTSTGSPLHMETHWLSVRSPANASIVHALRWETWPENADAARAVSPPAGSLMYYRMSDPNVTAILPARLGRTKTGPSLSFQKNSVLVKPENRKPVDLRGKVLPSQDPVLILP